MIFVLEKLDQCFDDVNCGFDESDAAKVGNVTHLIMLLEPISVLNIITSIVP